ncbi:MAG: hypothetical protein LKM38_21935 [Pseudomonas veronii]|nr:hypothetical protein [Pseudomonas veronii]
MSAIELAIRSLRPSLKDAFARALTRYWGQNAGGADNRWLWLSGMLSDNLRSAALKQPGLTDAQRATLDQVVTWPERAQRVSANGDDAARVFVLDTSVRYGGGASTQLSPDLLLTPSDRRQHPGSACRGQRPDHPLRLAGSLRQGLGRDAGKRLRLRPLDLETPGAGREYLRCASGHHSE